MSAKLHPPDRQPNTEPQPSDLEHPLDSPAAVSDQPTTERKRTRVKSQAQSRIEALFSDIHEVIEQVQNPANLVPPTVQEKPPSISIQEKTRKFESGLKPTPKPSIEKKRADETPALPLEKTRQAEPRQIPERISPQEEKTEPPPGALTTYDGSEIGLQALEEEQVRPASDLITPIGWKSLLEKKLLAQNATPDTPAMLAYGRALGNAPQTARGEEDAASVSPSLLLEIVDDDSDRRWTEEELLLIEQVMDQLTLAIENAELFDQTQRARDALQVSVRYQKSIADAVAILSERGFSAISEVLELLGKASQASRVYFMETQYDHHGPYWRIISEWHAPGLSAQMSNPGLHQLSPDLLRNWSQSMGKAGFLTFSQSSTTPDEQKVLEILGVKSVLQFPISVQQDTPGCIGFEQAGFERTWNSEEIAALQTAASALANTIVRENLFNQLQINLSETEAQYQASAQLNSANSPNEILAILRQFTILGHLNTSDVAIYAFDRPWSRAEKPDRLLPLARWTEGDRQENPLIRQTLAEWRNAEALFSPDRPTIVFDIASDPRFDEHSRQIFLEEMGSKSLLMIPLNVSGRWIGEIIAVYSQTTGFTERETRRLVSLSGQAAVAVESLRLLDETRQRNEELMAINQVTSAVSRTLQLDQVLAEILQRVLATTEFESGLMSYVNPDTGELTLAVHHELPHTMVQNLYENGLRGTPCDLVFQIGQTVYVPDLNHLPQKVFDTGGLLPPTWPHKGIEPAFKSAIANGFRSYLGVPLAAKGVPLGTVCIFSKETKWVPPERIALTETIGQQVGVAVDNARLFQSTQVALGETEALYQASSEINAVQSYDEILLMLQRYTILGKTDRLLCISLFDHPWSAQPADPHAGQYLALEDLDPPEWVIPFSQWSALPVENRLNRTEFRQFPAANLLSPNELTLIEDVNTDNRLDERTRQFFQSALQARSVLFIPLSLANQWIGFVISAFSVPIHLDELQIRRLAAIAGQAAVAIQNLRLLDESRRRANQLQTAAEIARDTSGTLALDNLLQRSVNQIVERFGYYHASIFLIDETGKEAIVRESTGLAGEEMKRDGHRLVVGGRSLIGQVTATGNPLVLNDVNSEEARHIFHHNPLLPLTRAELGIPLRIGEIVIGALDVQSDLANAFSEDDVAVLRVLSDQIAVAVDNATSYEIAQKAVEEIREADRLKTQFLANMSHELRTPLNSIIGFSRVILKGIDGPINEQQQQDLTAIYNSGQHLLGLINDVLDLSRIEAGKMDLSFEANINLGEIIRSVMSTTIGLVKDKPIELKQNISPELPVITVDPMKIRQVMINLLSNAAKFTEQGSITVEAEPYLGPDGEPQVIVRVIDTGPGIAIKDQVRLFQPFSQVDGSLTRRTGGSGLGLSICSHLIRMHGGQIGLESEIGKGSTFYFTLPVSQSLWSEDGFLDLESQPSSAARLTDPILKKEKPAPDKFQPSIQEAAPVSPPPPSPEPEPVLEEIEPAGSESILVGDEGAPPRQELTQEDLGADVSVDMESFEEQVEIEEAATFLAEPESLLESEEQDRTGPFLILAIEQDHKVIDLYKRYLSESNFTVISLTRLEQAVNVARGIQPFAITLDIAMTGNDRLAGTGPLLGPIYRKDGVGFLDGLKVLKDLKTDPGTKHIPVIVCSMLAEHEKAYKLGAADYLLKPILEEDLIQAIHRLQKK